MLFELNLFLIYSFYRWLRERFNERYSLYALMQMIFKKLTVSRVFDFIEKWFCDCIYKISRHNFDSILALPLINLIIGWILLLLSLVIWHGMLLIFVIFSWTSDAGTINIFRTRLTRTHFIILEIFVCRIFFHELIRTAKHCGWVI